MVEMAMVEIDLCAQPSDDVGFTHILCLNLVCRQSQDFVRQPSGFEMRFEIFGIPV